MSNYRNQDPRNRRADRARNAYEAPLRNRREEPATERASQRSQAPRERIERNRAAGTDPRQAPRSSQPGSPYGERARHSTHAALSANGYDRPVRQSAQDDPRRTARPMQSDPYGYQPEGRSRVSERQAAQRTNRASSPYGPRTASSRYQERSIHPAADQAPQAIREPRAQRRQADAARQGAQEQERISSQQARRSANRPDASRQHIQEADSTKRPARSGNEGTQHRRPDFAERLSSIAEKGAAAASEAGKAFSSAGSRVADCGKGALGSASSAKSSAFAWMKKARGQREEKSALEREQLRAEVDSAAMTGNNLGLEQQKIAELAVWHNRASKAFSAILTCGMILGLCFFLRPATSQAENRDLTKFPSFSIADLASGAYTEGISTWYADTYPFRDQLMGINKALKGLNGFESDTQMYGSAVQADDIPDEAAKTNEKKDPVAPETYDSFNLEEDVQGQIMQGLYVDEGTVYATYGFTQEAADDYVNAVNGAADKLEGTTQVYSILIPNNSGILLSKEELSALGGSNQAQAIQYYYDSYNDKVKTVPTMQPLLDHKDEYLFFRTDHHWTSLGAYYVYQALCEQKGVEAHNVEDYDVQEFAPFLGSYYAQLQLESLAQNPDTVQAWTPKGTNDMTYTDVNGQTVDWNVIKDVSDWDQGALYNCFAAGDQPWAEIHNPQITDGSSCLIVKESYGNAFVPWLVDHYENVYIVDFRYGTENVVDICKEKGVDDLILLNNISIIGSVDVAGKIASLL